MSYEGAKIKKPWFTSLTHRKKLVLPKAFPTPSAWAVVFPCSLLKASFQRSQRKTPLQLRWKGVCAQDWIRTSTPFPALPPQGSASTNFATWATDRIEIRPGVQI